jgi:hypothetical protein
MELATTSLHPHAERLLEALREPSRCLTFEPDTWDQLIRAARAARLLGTLSARVQAVIPMECLDPLVRRHLVAGQVEAEFRKQKMRYLLSTIEPIVSAATAQCVLLKGCAYLAQGLAFAEGRLPADVDVMVPRPVLERLERLLLGSGWQYDAHLTPYDHRYYRDWAHELPPLRCAGQALELDVHHTILPPLGRLKPDTRALFDGAAPVQGAPFYVLTPADQVLHAAAHLFHDSDCTNRLRDLVDIDALVRTFAAADSGFWNALHQRACLHHLGRPLWYAITFARTWLGTPVPDDGRAAIDAWRPRAPVASIVVRLIERALPPVDPDGAATRSRRWASRLLLGRTTWLRMPPHLVAYHGLHKLAGSLHPRKLFVKSQPA